VRRTAAFNPIATQVAPAFEQAQTRYGMIGGAAALLLAFAGGAFAFSRLAPAFRARTRVERIVMATLLTASLIAIFTTLGIILSLLFESLRFFARVSPIEFLFGLNWSPQTAIRADQAGSSGAFGAIPLFWGTIFIGAIIAMIVAIPLGLMSAVYLTQYATPRVRRWMKPLLEVLAGVPTVVYGYFAALTVAPADPQLRHHARHPSSSESALAAGLGDGNHDHSVRLVDGRRLDRRGPAGDARRLARDGRDHVGDDQESTRPAALPGVGRRRAARGQPRDRETMIVVMAAGLAANLTANPFASVTTVTTQIVQLLTGDQEFDSAKTLAAFALGLVLFIVTLL
jgi:phosphate transport system permease protein